MVAADTTAPSSRVPDFIRLFGSRTAYLLVSMPLAIFSFVVTVTLLALGIGLMPLGIGFFIYWFGLAAADRLYVFDQWMVAQLVRYRDGSHVDFPSPQRIALRRIFLEKSYYRPVLYNLVKLPISILQFVVVVTFVICGFAMLFTPLVYVILDRFGIPMYEGDIVMTVLFPNLTPYQYSFFGTALGVVFLVIGLSLMPKVIRLAAVAGRAGSSTASI